MACGATATNEPGIERFARFGYEDFRRFAIDDQISKYNKIGFPDSYRRGFEEAIFADICRKLSVLEQKEIIVLDIGPGCGDLPLMMLKHGETWQHRLVLVDSPEMLAYVPDRPFVIKVAGMYPANADAVATVAPSRVEALLRCRLG